jgi:hypothetical protein
MQSIQSSYSIGMFDKPSKKAPMITESCLKASVILRLPP